MNRRIGLYRYKKTVILLLGLLIIASVMPVFATDFYTCAICGKSRSLTHVFGFTMEPFDSETPCSLWYGMNVELNHAHVWVRGTWRERKGVFGFPRIGSNFSTRASGPLIRFGASERLLIYQHSQNAEAARNIFLRLAHWETDSSKRLQQVRLELELSEWLDGGFVGPLPQTDYKFYK